MEKTNAEKRKENKINAPQKIQKRLTEIEEKIKKLKEERKNYKTDYKINQT